MIGYITLYVEILRVWTGSVYMVTFCFGEDKRAFILTGHVFVFKLVIVHPKATESGY